jgi:hypothetical protein
MVAFLQRWFGIPAHVLLADSVASKRYLCDTCFACWLQEILFARLCRYDFVQLTRIAALRVRRVQNTAIAELEEETRLSQNTAIA